MQTLTQFVDNQIKKYDLSNKFVDEDKQFFKIRIKAQRELEKLGYWKNAKTETIGKAKTRVFTNEQLGKLEVEMTPYLEKLSTKANKLNYSQVKDLASKIADGENKTPTEEKLEQFHKGNETQAPIISKKDVEQKKQQIMFEALFEHFFTPVNTKKLENLMITIELTDDEFKKASALKELNHPKGHLFKRKTIFERLKSKLKRKN